MQAGYGSMGASPQAGLGRTALCGLQPGALGYHTTPARVATDSAEQHDDAPCSADQHSADRHSAQQHRAAQDRGSAESTPTTTPAMAAARSDSGPAIRHHPRCSEAAGPPASAEHPRLAGLAGDPAPDPGAAAVGSRPASASGSVATAPAATSSPSERDAIPAGGSGAAAAASAGRGIPGAAPGGSQPRPQPAPAQPAQQAAAESSAEADGPIVIVGGGFGGLYTALALAEQPHHPPILLIEPHEQFLFLPLLYELLSGELRQWEVAPRYDRLLAGRGIAWLQDRVERIEAGPRRLHTRGGQTLSYRRLVIASGGASDTFGIPGADRHCLGFRNLADVERLQSLVADLARRRRPLQRLAVVGAGPTGVELACKLADLCAGSAIIELIEQGPRPLPQAKAFNREQAELALQRRDVRLRCHTAVVAVEADRLLLRHRATTTDGDGRTAPGDELLAVQGVIWTAGLRFRPPALQPDPPRDRRGRLRCEPSLRLLGDEAIFVAGDLASVAGEDGDPLPSTAQVAFQQAPLLAENLRRSLRGEPLQDFHWNDLGEMLSLGRQEASLSGAGLTLAGRTAFRIRQLAYLTRMPGLPHTVRVAAGWLADWGR